MGYESTPKSSRSTGTRLPGQHDPQVDERMSQASSSRAQPHEPSSGSTKPRPVPRDGEDPPQRWDINYLPLEQRPSPTILIQHITLGEQDLKRHAGHHHGNTIQTSQGNFLWHFYIVIIGTDHRWSMTLVPIIQHSRTYCRHDVLVRNHEPMCWQKTGK